MRAAGAWGSSQLRRGSSGEAAAEHGARVGDVLADAAEPPAVPFARVGGRERLDEPAPL